MPNSYLTYLIGFFMFLLSSLSYAETISNSRETTESSKTPPKLGNFALPSSQQIGPLISLGQNIIDKGQTQLFLSSFSFMGSDQRTHDVTPSIVHQATDNLSLLLSQPIAISYRQDQDHSSGLGDVLLQLEYAFHMKETSDFTEQATLVSYITLPSGSSEKQPATGLGSPSFLLGGTFNRTYVDWYEFTSGAIVETTSQNGIKFGNQLLYQCGLSKNLFSVPSKCICAALLEVYGIYTEKTKINGLTVSDSGGNIIYLVPSLWFSGKKLIIQFGAGAPITQHLFGNQKETHYLVAANIGWTF
jgi:hypothetical protein